MQRVAEMENLKCQSKERRAFETGIMPTASDKVAVHLSGEVEGTEKFDLFVDFDC